VLHLSSHWSACCIGLRARPLHLPPPRLACRSSRELCRWGVNAFTSRLPCPALPPHVRIKRGFNWPEGRFTLRRINSTTIRTFYLVSIRLLELAGDLIGRQLEHGDQGVTPCWKSVHWISKISAENHKRISRENWPNFNSIPGKFKQNIKKSLPDIPKYLPGISGQWSESEKNLKNRWKQPCFDRIYPFGNRGLLYPTASQKSHDPCFHKKHMESGVMTFVAHCTPYIMSCHPLMVIMKL